MPCAWLFNPENDIALARGTANFTPPPAAVAMQRAGRLLPFFLAADSDFVICDGVNAEQFDAFRRRFAIKADVWNHCPDGLTPSPWGWSLAARRRFANLGFPPSVLPSDADLERWRLLSHRRTAALLARSLAGEGSLPLWPTAVEVSDPARLPEVLLGLGRAVVKQPWSSSGRGVAFFTSGSTSLDTVVRQAAGTIRRQGSVMVEPFMPDHRDFALLYECAGGRARFLGPSLFRADPAGRYLGNLVASDEFLFQELCRLLPSDLLHSLIEGLARALTAIVAPGWSGPVGIDICCDPRATIHICEANLRFTMGFVARAIARRLPPTSPFVLSPADWPD